MQLAQHTTNTKSIRKDFAILQSNPPLTYLDSAATSLTPNQVLEAMNTYYTSYNASVHRGTYVISEQATQAYENAREKIAEFIHAHKEEVIFTKNTTESLNLLAYTLTEHLNPGDEIVLTQMEHHSNLIPWQQLAKKKKLKLTYVRITPEGHLDMNHARECITKKTKIVSVAHISNVLGTINNVQELARIAHENNALFIVDGAQAIPHTPVNVRDIGCDFYCFSGHKMLGPTGIGVLYGKKEHLHALHPFLYGGGMISTVTYTDTTWAQPPEKFEAGTPNIAEAIGLGAATDYLFRIGMQAIVQHEHALTAYALQRLRAIPGITIYGPLNAHERAGLISFTLEGIHSHDIAAILDKYRVAVRGGHMCAMPLLHETLHVNDLCRISFSVYNTQEDIDLFITGLEHARRVFHHDTRQH